MPSQAICNEFRRKIADFREDGVGPYRQRDVSVVTADRSVSTIIGARRCGKSFRTYQLIDDMVSDGALAGVEHVCPVDFDNPHFGTMEATELGELRDEFLAVTPSASRKTPLLFVFDEIHRVKGWEDFVVDLSRTPAWRVVVTGSSSRMLRTDISTTLRGKALSTTMYPLSFRESLRFSDIDPNAVHGTEGRGRAIRAFEHYLQWGGFPAVALLVLMRRSW